MGLRIRFIAGPLPGGYDVYASSVTYAAGQPLKITANGVELCQQYIEGNDDGFLGFARNHFGSTTDLKSDAYNGRAAYISGKGNILELNDDDPENGSDVFPFHDNTYTVGEDLYISTTGFLTNTAPGGSNGGVTPASSTPVAFVLEGRTAAGGANLIVQTL